MITNQLFRDEYDTVLKDLSGIYNDGKLNKINLKDYISSGKGRIRSTSKNRIAVVYAQGDIRYGKGDEDYIGQELIIKALRKARNSSSVKAIVFRVNSPGGSALASDMIWRELKLTKEEKPVVVSMGNMAASGGYYISCMANKIIAEPTTITGSIGVFGMIPNLKNFLNDRLGLTFDGVSTNANSDMGSVAQPLTPFQQKVIQNSVVDIYTAFITHVAEGRNMTKEKVDYVCNVLKSIVGCG